MVHEQPGEWADALGETLETLRVRFYDELAWLGARSRTSRSTKSRLQWVCLNRGDRGISRSPEFEFSAAYETRTHSVRLFWTASESVEQEFGVRGVNAFQPAYSGGSGAQESPPPRHLFVRISHEVAHQLAFDCGLQERGVMYPLWVSEGLATGFESPRPEQVDFLGPNASRLQRLQELQTRNGLTALDEFVTIVDTTSLDRSEQEDFYAQAWSFFRFLGQQHGRALKKYLKQMARLPMGHRSKESLREEMTAAFGSLDKLEAEWRTWLTAQGNPLAADGLTSSHQDKKGAPISGAPQG
ncbi:MAG: hypothetical protein A2X46_04300 [Lentisphaerae bacterium GWF2_57_35]|nr:MAG: hypothetical protein A2X46_04300 [Lentisphaerae bacterium GWF2_57_35]